MAFGHHVSFDGMLHPERMWSALSWQEQMKQLRLLDMLVGVAFCFYNFSCVPTTCVLRQASGKSM